MMPDAPRHRSRWFILGYGAAQAGAFISFIPLLSLLLPLKAEAIAGGGKEVLLGQIAFLGGLVAAGANLLFGHLSDRTRGRFGRRRPWLVAGVAAVAVALATVAAAPGPLTLALAIVLFQLAVNALYAPLLALVPDMVPDAQKGLVSAWASAALPAANLFTAIAVSPLTPWPAAAFALVALATAAMVLPLALRLREPVATPIAEEKRIGFSLVALRDPLFRAAFASRLLAEAAVAINTLYLLFFLKGPGAGSAPSGWSATQQFGVLLVASTIAAAAGGFIGGAVSDRLGRRRGFVIGGAVLMAVALALFVGLRAWPGPLVSQLLFGLGHGVHAATVAAMTAEILPDRRHAGRDLGVMNVAVALPQSFAPAAAAAMLMTGMSLLAVFGAAAGCALLAAGWLLLTPWRRAG